MACGHPGLAPRFPLTNQLVISIRYGVKDVGFIIGFRDQSYAGRGMISISVRHQIRNLVAKLGQSSYHQVMDEIARAGWKRLGLQSAPGFRKRGKTVSR